MCKTFLLKKIAVLVVLLLTAAGANAQRVAIKTNALYWTTLSPNLGMELRLSRHYTLNIDAGFNPFKISDKFEPRFIGISPEIRYWFDARPQSHHFIGALALGSSYKFLLKDKQHDGSALGLGMTYGYSFVLGKRWSLETTIGAGLLKIKEKEFRKGDEIPEKVNRSKYMFAPLKVGVSFVYIIK